MSLVKKIILGLLAVLLLSQFIQPKKNEGDYNLKTFFEETQADEKIQGLVEKACVDCHSNKTKYPWYSKITPVNFWIKHHIEEGKEHLNLSEWSSYNKNQKAHALHEFYEEVEHQKMPLKTYILQHSEAKLSDSETELIVNWAKKAKTTFE